MATYFRIGGVQAPATAETAQVFERMKDLGVLMGKGGLHGNCFRIKPPVILAVDQLTSPHWASPSHAPSIMQLSLFA